MLGNSGLRDSQLNFCNCKKLRPFGQPLEPLSWCQLDPDDLPMRSSCFDPRVPVFFHCFSPTAESFGVSAQIGSGVVRGDREVRFHEGSTRVPAGSARAAGWSFEVRFHEGSLRGLRGGPGWFEVRFHEGSTRVPPGFHQGSTRFNEWFEVRFHEGSTKAPSGCCGVVRGGLR